MSWLRHLWLRVRGLWRAEAIRDEIDEELEFHIDMRTDENVERGMPLEEARRDAEQRFGRVLRIQEQGYDVRGGRWLEEIVHDLRYAARILWSNKTFTAAAILTLGLGIGASTAIFSVVDAVLLRPLPFHDPDRLFMLWERNPEKGDEQNSVAAPNYVDWVGQDRAFDELAAFTFAQHYNLTSGDRPERVDGARVSANLFHVLGVTPLLGRTFLAEEDEPGRDRAILLSHSLWVRRFGADPRILGQTVSLDGLDSTVVGVMPPAFQFPGGTGTVFGSVSSPPAELWVPLALTEHERSQRSDHWLQVIARLKPGLTPEQAASEMSAIQRAIEQAHPNDYLGSEVKVVALYDQVVGSVRPTLLVLVAAVAFLLLIACANVANLLLARAATRHREIALRTALGASRFRVIRQLLTESVLLALAGAAVGVLLAGWCINVLLATVVPSGYPRIAEARIDLWALAFTLLVSLLTGIAFGLAPALQLSKPNLSAELKDGGRGLTESVRRTRVRNLLVVSEIALALVLVTSATLLIRSFLRLELVDPGFDSSQVVTLELSLPAATYPQRAQRTSFFSRLMERVTTLPGVGSAGAVTDLPLSGGNMNFAFDIEGRAPITSGKPTSADYRAVTPGYFRAMGIPVVRGRAFTEQDDASAAPVVIVNETLARNYFPGEDPIGRRVKLGVNNFTGEIVGIVGDVKHTGLASEVREEAYGSYAQTPFWRSMTLVIRGEADPGRVAAAVRAEVAAIDAQQPTGRVRTLDQVLSDSVAAPRFRTMVLGLFAGAALMLAVIGIYGVVSYSVSQRRHELGVRLALGAQPGDMLRLVVGQAMALASIGVASGTLAAYAATRGLSSLLFEVSPTDPGTFVGVAAVLACAAFVASLIPARRATKVDPLVALRYE